MIINIQDIRIQQRNGKKSLTTVTGLPADLDFKKILKAFKKVRVFGVQFFKFFISYSLATVLLLKMQTLAPYCSFRATIVKMWSISSLLKALQRKPILKCMARKLKPLRAYNIVERLRDVFVRLGKRKMSNTNVIDQNYACLAFFYHLFSL